MRRQVTPLLWQFGGGGGLALPDPAEAGRTFVLAPFGGGSAYALADWTPQLLREGEAALALQYPGRGPRTGEPYAEELAALAWQAADDIAAHAAGPVVLVGHSLGGVLAYEIAVRLEDQGRDVELLAVSAARAPDSQRLSPSAVLGMSREDWLAELETAGDARIDDAVPEEIVDLMIPVLRADYLLLARYRCAARRPVSCPLLAVGGSADPWVDRGSLDAWEQWTSGEFTGRMLPGGHFYYRDRTADLCRLIRAALPLPVVVHGEREPSGGGA